MCVINYLVSRYMQPEGPLQQFRRCWSSGSILHILLGCPSPAFLCKAMRHPAFQVGIPCLLRAHVRLGKMRPAAVNDSVASISGVMGPSVAQPTAGATQRILTGLFEGLGVRAATQQPQPPLQRRSKSPPPKATKVTDEATIVPSKYRALTPDWRRSRLPAEGISSLLCLEQLLELLGSRGPVAYIPANRDIVDFDPLPSLVRSQA